MVWRTNKDGNRFQPYGQRGLSMVQRHGSLEPSSGMKLTFKDRYSQGSDRSDWTDMSVEQRIRLLKEFGVADAYRYANLSYNELPEHVWKIYVTAWMKEFKELQMGGFK